MSSQVRDRKKMKLPTRKQLIDKICADLIAEDFGSDYNVYIKDNMLNIYEKVAIEALPEEAALVIEQNFTENDGKAIVDYLKQLDITSPGHIYNILQTSPVAAASPDVIIYYLSACTTQEQKNLILLLPEVQRDPVLQALIHIASVHTDPSYEALFKDITILLQNNFIAYIHALQLLQIEPSLETRLTQLLHTVYTTSFEVSTICNDSIIFSQHITPPNMDAFRYAIDIFEDVTGKKLPENMRIVTPEGRTHKETEITYTCPIVDCLIFSPTEETYRLFQDYIHNIHTQSLPHQVIKDELLYCDLSIVLSGIVYKTECIEKLKEVDTTIQTLLSL